MVKNNQNIWRSLQLSRDHKPELDEEYKRILSKRGRVFPFYDCNGTQLGPHRVWHPHLDYPGLAMSRSLGDYVAHQYGVSSDPELDIYEIQPEDQYIVIASDGIWEFLSNQEVVDTLTYGIQEDDYKRAVNDLVDHAHNQWVLNDTCIDDIT